MSRKITQDGRYLHHDKKPVLFVWGFYSDRFGPALAHRIIDFFKSDPKYGVTLIGGCQWWWRTEKDAEWARAFRRFDVISPWNVGNFTKDRAARSRRPLATGRTTWRKRRRLGWAICRSSIRASAGPT